MQLRLCVCFRVNLPCYYGMARSLVRPLASDEKKYMSTTGRYDYKKTDSPTKINLWVFGSKTYLEHSCLMVMVCVCVFCGECVCCVL